MQECEDFNEEKEEKIKALKEEVPPLKKPADMEETATWWWAHRELIFYRTLYFYHQV